VQASSARDFSTKPVFHESDLGYALISLEIFAALYRDAPGIFCDREREREREGERQRKERKSSINENSPIVNMLWKYVLCFPKKKEARDNFVEK